MHYCFTYTYVITLMDYLLSIFDIGYKLVINVNS